MTRADDLRRAARDGLRRTLAIRQIDTEARTVEVAFATDTPVSRAFGDEVLAINNEAIRRDRLDAGAAVLLNHDWDYQIGVVERVEIEGGIARARLRFGRGARADEVFQDIVDGIRRHVSVGYLVHRVETERREGQPDLVRVTDWEPFEVSIVAVPADNNTGVGRSRQGNSRSETMPDQPAAPAQPTTTTTAPPPDTGEDRVSRVLELGRAYGRDSLAAQVLRDGGGAPEMQAALLREMSSRGGQPMTEGGEIGMSPRETRSFSIIRLAQYLAAPSPETASAAGLELEASRAFAEQTGRQPQGAFVPPDVLGAADFGRRDMQTGTAAEGGAIVAENLQAQAFIDMLRNRLSVMQAGVQVINGLVGNVVFPRLSGGASHEWLPEGGSVTDSQPILDTVPMTPHTVASSIPMTRRLLIQSTPDVEAVVRRDLAARIALAIDQAALNGDGPNSPNGLWSMIAAGAATWATAGKPTFAEMIALETAVAEANADMGSLAFIYGPGIAGALKSTPIEAGNPRMIEEGGMVGGQRRIVSNQVEAGDVFFGNWADMLIGFWSGLDVRVDTATLAASDGLVIRAFQDLDVAVRHVESFALASNPSAP